MVTLLRAGRRDTSGRDLGAFVDCLFEAPVGIAFFSRDLQVLRANRRGEALAPPTARMMAALQQVLATGERVVHEETTRVVSFVPVRENGEVVGVTATVIEAPEQAAHILESITDGFFALDDGWRFTYVNGAAERLLGKKRDLLLGRRVFEEFPNIVGRPVFRAWRRAVRS